MEISKTSIYEPLHLGKEQLAFVSSNEAIANALQQDHCLGFYAYENSEIIGFALLREFDKERFFLWDFLIDSHFQGCGKGKEFLRLLIKHLFDHYSAALITTTYIWGNEVAKKLYESLGFMQTDIVCENAIHEVNMQLQLRSQ